MHELCYTSAPKGIRPGSSGYTTVAHTKDLPSQLFQRLEGLSTFDHIDKNAAAYANNPVNHAHLTMGSGQQRLHVLSRIAACEPDHSGRTNYFAQHIVISEPESRGIPAGPAAIAGDHSVFKAAWTGEPRLLPPRQLPAVAERGRAAGPAWKSAGLDPSWADYLADRVQRRGKPLFLIYPKGTDVLALVADVVAAVPVDQRWGVTFATHATAGFPGLGLDCQVRCVVAGTPYAAEAASRSKPEDCIDLSTRPTAPAVVRRESRGDVAAAQETPGPRPLAAGRLERQTGGSIGRPAEKENGIGRRSVPASGGAIPEHAAISRTVKRSAILAWMFAATTLVASVVAAFFAHEYRNERSRNIELTSRLEQQEIKQGQRNPERWTRENPGASPFVKSEPDSQPAADERENKKPAPAIDFGDPPAAIELAKQPIANDKERVDAKPTPSPTGSERKPPGGESPQTASPTFKFTDAATVRDAADKAKGKQFEVTLVSGLTKTDEVQVTVGSGGEAVGCELIKKQRTVHPQWELKERNGNKKLLAKFECKGNELKLDIEDSPKSESLRYVAFIVEVSPAGNSTAKREFCLAEPSKERFSLTPVKRKTSSDFGAQNLTEYSHDEKFRLFVDENASKRLMSLMKENPHLGLKLACDKNRIIANLQNQDDKVSVLYIQPVQVKATTRTTAAEAQCGIVLEKSTDPDLVFRLTKYSFPKPHPNIGGSEPLEWPPRPVHKEEAVKSLKDKLTNATEACTEKENKCGDSKLTTDQKTQCEQQLTNLKQVKQDAQNNYDAGKINFEESFTFVNSITLEDFQDVPVLVTLCDNNSNDKIVIIDSLSLATSQK